MKTISIVVPTYNEELNIMDIYYRIQKIFTTKLNNYNFKILFIDNYSADHTRDIVRTLAEKDRQHVQAIFNANNFGFSKSTFYGLTQAEGDCAIMLYADMQDPPELISKFVEEWEQGNKLVVGIKKKSKENRIVYIMRSLYYKLVSKLTDHKHINQFDGFGLYDADFIKIIRNIDDPLPYLRGMVAEFGYARKEIEYTQDKRKKGKTSFNLSRYIDTAMLGLTSSPKGLARIATIMGTIMSIACILLAIITFILKLVNWNHFAIGTAAIIVGLFFIGGINLFYLGMLGEYIVNMNVRIMKHPIVVEEERINF